MNIRTRRFVRTLVWIVIPAISSFFAGLWFASFGPANTKITIWVAILLICAGEAAIEQSISTAIGVVFWALEIVTGVLLMNILNGMFVNIPTWKYVLYILGLVAMLLLTVGYAKEMLKDVYKR